MMIAAERAASALVRDFGELEKLQVSRKGFKDFVTSADLRTERRLVYELSKFRPEFSFICEESGETIGNKEGSVWAIDPIDGTTNFMRGIPYFAINIALLEKGEVVVGLTLDPMRGSYFTAVKGGGAFLGKRQRLRVSGREELVEALVAVHTTTEEEDFIRRKGAITRRTGAIALDLAYLASGKFDVVFARDVGLWDVASGIILTRESGGFIKYKETSPSRFTILASASMSLISHLTPLYSAR
jgi:myo-inositol-1(or 4)-monophosphatase